MTVIPLGTGSSTLRLARRFTSAALLQDQSNGKILLFDCGDGTQRSLLHAKLKINRIEAIFVTHLHSDHYMGLAALVATMELLYRHAPLTLIVPEQLADALPKFPGTRASDLSFPVQYIPIHEGLGQSWIYENDHFMVEARALDHNIATTGYRVQERIRPGKLNVKHADILGIKHRDRGVLKSGKTVTGHGGRIVTPAEVLGPSPTPRAFAYVTDTRPCKGGVLLARNADLLIHDSTFGRHNTYGTAHSTASDAADVAKEAGAKRLLLTHFGASICKDVDTLLQEARAIFPDTEAAEEFKRYPIPLSGKRH